MAKKEKEEPKKSEKSDEKETEEFISEEDEGFGGLPDRDLKKNLGCG